MTVRHGRAAVPFRRLAATAVAVGALSGVAACGNPPALDELSATQQTQLDAAWTARISATDTAPITGDARNERARALNQACKTLDAANPLLAAVAALCGPTASYQKLGVLLPERCSTPAQICVRALDRIAAATEQEGQQLAKVSAEAKRLVTEPACLAQFTTTETRVAGFGELAAAYRVLALGVEREEEDIADLGERKVNEAKAAIAPKGTIAERTASFRADCMGQG